MGFVRGVIPSDFTAGDEWLRDLPDDGARRAVWEAFVDAVLTIGTADGAGLGLRTGLGAELDWWDRYIGWATDGAPPSDLADVLTWCSANQPSTEPPAALLWGDVRLGNVVFDPRRRHAGGGARLGHDVGRPDRDGPRVVPRSRRRCRPTSAACRCRASGPMTTSSPGPKHGPVDHCGISTGT